MFDELTALNNSWNFLQQPVSPDEGLNATFRALLAAVDQGWQVTQPVKKLQASRSIAWNYHFNLFHRNIHQLCQIIIPETAEIEGFILNNEYQVEKITNSLL